MLKKFLVIVMSISILLGPSACSQQNGMKDILNSSQQNISSQQASIPVTPMDEVDITNNATFIVDVENGTIIVEATYTKRENLGTAFLLNRDFTVTKLISDGKEVGPQEKKESINFGEGYLANRYSFPPFEKNLYVAYTGYLSGESSMAGYARETISKDYTLLRMETFCYPIFADDFESSMAFFTEGLEAEITVNVPAPYIAATPFSLIRKTESNGRTSYLFDGDIASFNCAIAQFQTYQLPSGEYYFLPDNDVEEMANFITPIMAEAQQFMSENFGEVDISSTMRYIVIPDSFGAYAPGGAVFIDESAFTSAYEMGQLIHEFIHLGWNAKTETHIVQRSRFFDEAFTSYFTARVLGHLIGEETYQSEIERCKKSISSMIGANKKMLVPIIDYGKYEYGHLSYVVGPIFFDELSKLVGKDTSDAATKVFLEKYQDIPVDFDIMCSEYIELCNNPDLENFFQNWFYSTRAIEQIIDEV